MPPGEMDNTEIQEDSVQILEEEYKTIFSRLKTTYQAFVTDYLKTFDSKQSAIAAGYSPKSAVKQGSRLCRNEFISQCVRLQQRINSLRSKLSTAWVMSELKARYDACVTEGKHQAATRCLELIGQHLGMFGKGEKDKSGDLHLHQHYVDYPPVPESIQAWVEQMKEVGYEAALPEPTGGGEALDKLKEADGGKDETKTRRTITPNSRGKGLEDTLQ